MDEFAAETSHQVHDLLTAVFALPDLADVATLPEMQAIHPPKSGTSEIYQGPARP